MPRGLWLAPLCALVPACPMPNPAWVESAATSDTSSMSAGSLATGGETTTGTTAGSAATDATGPTASSEPTTSDTASTTSDVSTSSTSEASTDSTSDTSESSGSSTTGLTCDDVLDPQVEANALELTLDLAPEMWVLNDPNSCGPHEIWTGGAKYTPLGGGRFSVDLIGGCGDQGNVSVSGRFPADLVPNLNAGDCVRIRAFLAWDKETQTCDRLLGFEIEDKVSKELLFAAASGLTAMSPTVEVTPGLVTGCPATAMCDGEPGVYELTSALAGVTLAEGAPPAITEWQFYNRRSHVHDAIDPREDAMCTRHLDWIVNRVP